MSKQVASAYWWFGMAINMINRSDFAFVLANQHNPKLIELLKERAEDIKSHETW